MILVRGSASISEVYSMLIFFATHSAVGGMICIKPTAPLLETASRLKPLSAFITDAMSTGSTLYVVAAWLMCFLYLRGYSVNKSAVQTMAMMPRHTPM